MECKHNVSLLVGTAKGIRCKGCGQILKEFPGQAIEVKEPEEPVPEELAPEEPKKEPAPKKTTKGGKK